MKKYLFILNLFMALNSKGLYNTEFKTIDTKLNNITDDFIIEKKELNSNLDIIYKLIKDKEFLKAQLILKKQLNNSNDKYINSLLILANTDIIKNIKTPQKAIKYLENNLESGFIDDDNIANTYIKLLELNVKHENINKIDFYYNIIKELYQDTPEYIYKSDIEYAKFLINKNNFIKAKQLLENILYKTENSQLAATSSIVLSKLLFKEQKDFKNITKLLTNIFQYKKEFFLDNMDLLIENLDLFKKYKEPIYFDILEYMFDNIIRKEYKKEWKEIGFLLYEKHMKNKEYIKAKKSILTMSYSYEYLNKKDLSKINLRLDYIYGLLKIKNIDDLIKKYKRTSFLKIFKIIKMKHLIEDKNINEAFKYYQDYIAIQKKYFDIIYLNKIELDNDLNTLIFNNKIIMNNFKNMKNDKNISILTKIVENKLEQYQSDFPINHNILEFLNYYQYYDLNKKLYNMYLEETNIIINRDLLSLFIRTDVKHTLFYIDKVLNDKEISNLNKKYFYIARINILVLEKDVGALKEQINYFNVYQLTPKEEKDILYNYYLLLKTVPTDEYYLEEILLYILNLSSSDIKFRPFVDFELILLQNEKEEYKKSLVLLDNIPRKIFLNKEIKAKLYYFYSYIYNELGETKKRNKYLNKCLTIIEDNIWVQNCKFFKKRL
jgi:predicted negative regulator of RcsB-dependent stress response